MIIHRRSDGYLKSNIYYDRANDIVIADYDDIYDEDELKASISAVYQYFRLNRQDRFLLDLRDIDYMKDYVLDFFENVIFRNLKNFDVKKVAILGRNDVIKNMDTNYVIDSMTEVQVFFQDYSSAIKFLTNNPYQIQSSINTNNHC